MEYLILSGLSMERKGGKNTLSGETRYNKITEIIRTRKPDLLLCAGDTLDRKALYRLAEDKNVKAGRTTIVLETEGAKDKKETPKAVKSKSQNKQDIMLIQPNGSLRKLGEQILVNSRELRSSRGRSEKGQDLRAQLEQRSFEIAGKKVLCLICGEINFFKYRRADKTVSFFDSDNFPDIQSAFEDADIILNPTHDRMAERGDMLKTKRAYLSRRIEKRERYFMSVSNWDSEKRTLDGRKTYRQAANGDSLHKVYQSSNPLSAIDWLYNEDDKMIYSAFKANF